MSDDSGSFVVSEDEMPVVKAVPKSGPMMQPAMIEDEMPDLGEFSSDEDKGNGDAGAVVETEPQQFLTTDLHAEDLTTDAALGTKSTQVIVKSFRSGRGLLSIPILNSSTVDPETYNLERLMDPKVQKKAETGDRFSASHVQHQPKRSKAKDEPDFIHINKTTAAHPRASRSQDAVLRVRASAPDPVNVEERFYKYQKAVEAKVRRMEEEQEQREKMNCTFSPAILETHRPGENPRSADVFFQEMLQHQLQVAAKVQAERAKTEQAADSQRASFFRPQLCDKSKQMVQAKGAHIPAHEKLYQGHKEMMQKRMKNTEQDEDSDVSDTTQDSAKPFVPVINKASLRIVRDKPIEDLLMEDAKRRQRKYDSLPQSPKPRVQPSTNSNLLLAKRFKAEFAAAWDSVTDASVLSYTNTAELLKLLQFIENDSGSPGYECERALINRLWKCMALGDDGSVAKGDLETFLLAVMNYPVAESKPREESAVEEKQKSEGESDAPEKGNKPAVVIGRIEDGGYRLAPGERWKVHREFKLWFEHKNDAMKRISRQLRPKDMVEYTYSPELNKGSKQLASQRLANITSEGFQSHHEYLVADASRREVRRKELESKVDKEVMQECTFAPKLQRRARRMNESAETIEVGGLAGEYLRLAKESGSNPRMKTQLLYSLSPIVHQRRKLITKTPEERLTEHSSLQCSFAPDVSVTSHFSSERMRAAELPKGVEKAVQRLEHARRTADKVKALRDSGMPRRRVSVFEASMDIPEGPIIILAVMINGRAEELRIRPGEDIDALIRVFAQQHRLSEDDASIIQEQLKAQYLSRDSVAE